jgi:hypothetical protein
MEDVARVDSVLPISLERPVGGKLRMWWGNSENLLKHHPGWSDGKNRAKAVRAGD